MFGTAASLTSGTHPIVPQYLPDGSVNNCFESVVIQDVSTDGSNPALVEPYVGEECVSEEFEVIDPVCPP